MSKDEGVRIGTAEREEAMELLSRQFSEGRLAWLALPVLGMLLYGRR